MNQRFTGIDSPQALIDRQNRLTLAALLPQR